MCKDFQYKSGYSSRDKKRHDINPRVTLVGTVSVRRNLNMQYAGLETRLEAGDGGRNEYSHLLVCLPGDRTFTVFTTVL
jgi:hypothetical protein